MFPKYICCQFGTLPGHMFMSHPTSLVPIEEILKMIRAINIDQNPNPECSLFWINVVLYIKDDK